jgi:hypothetical protein
LLGPDGQTLDSAAFGNEPGSVSTAKLKHYPESAQPPLNVLVARASRTQLPDVARCDGSELGTDPYCGFFVSRLLHGDARLPHSDNLCRSRCATLPQLPCDAAAALRVAIASLPDEHLCELLYSRW